MKNIFVFSLFVLAFSACSTTQKCVENPKPDCICTMQYDPVCGCNNKTYGNACAAQCAGITSYTKGECKQGKNASLEGTEWRLKTITTGGKTQNIPSDITITATFVEGKVAGNGGCNSIGGNYILDGQTLKVSDLFSTKMYCEKAMKWENLFTASLSNSQTFRINGNNLEINCGDKGMLVFGK